VALLSTHLLYTPRVRSFAHLRATGLFAALVLFALPNLAEAQGPAGDSTVTPEPVATPVFVESTPLPFFLSVGAGFGQRSDPCAHCTSPENTDSFTGHVSLGKRLGYGFAIGVDASVWSRAHPGPQLAADSTGAVSTASLTNMLGNASASLSYQVWNLFIRGGGGLAWGSQDFESVDGTGDPTVVRASGKGIGYSVGAGIKLPLASMVSMLLFANYNVGTYDLVSVEGVLQRDARHEYLEVGFGLTIR
jgi:hypothetical protein